MCIRDRGQKANFKKTQRFFRTLELFQMSSAKNDINLKETEAQGKSTAKSKSKKDADGSNKDDFVKKEEDTGDSKLLGKRKASGGAETVAAKKEIPPVKGQVTEIKVQEKWWEKEIGDDDDETKWRYLEHHGVCFPPFYKPHGIRIFYKGEPINLTTKQEELATYWSQTVGSDWEKRDIYRKNFEEEFKKALKDKNKKLDDFDFTPIVNHLAKIKEEKKNRSKEDKQKEKEAKAVKDLHYGGAIVDGLREKVGGYMIEPPTLFKGRGQHPKAGFLKARIMPEDITINCAETAPVPKCDMPGHAWKDIVHDNQVTWLAYYRDDTINTAYKYIFLAASSKFKGLNDRAKYEKARKLKDHIHKIREDYTKKLADKNIQNRQLGTAAYLIDVLALRVGNEKSEDEADTVGCCSLRIEHITIEPDNKITLDFLGKDSMRYYNTVAVDAKVHKNLADFVKGKRKEENLFDEIAAPELNNYLGQLMEGLTAKVFRTYNASWTLQQARPRRAQPKGCFSYDFG
eukprot:TRINITY_DN1052_c0_g1_i15.p1 TRINITY_DN1052_c0_g1~~TRINITY_DN1052_c0_g1_i15.p1  ORF type:complete len:515 (-),score=151.01 TRINITY_DN1052_c0_g1_i15:746-2290(-)